MFFDEHCTSNLAKVIDGRRVDLNVRKTYYNVRINVHVFKIVFFYMNIDF